MDIRTSAPALLTRSVASRIAPIGLENGCQLRDLLDF